MSALLTDERLVYLIKQGFSYGEIAEEAGVTRSVISGRVYRMKKNKVELPKKVSNSVAIETRPKMFVPRSPKLHSDKTSHMTKSELREMLRQAVENT